MADTLARAGSIRVRTTAAALVVVALALAAAGVGVTRAVSSSLLDGLRAEMAETVRGVAADLDRGVAPRRVVPRPAAGARFLPPTIQIVDPRADEIVATLSPSVPAIALDGPAPRLEPPPVPFADEPLLDLIDAPGWLVHTAPADGYVVVAASPRSLIDANTATLARSLWIGSSVLALVVAVLTWLMVGRALRPVERMRREAEAITARTLDRRIPVTGSDEIGRLAHTLNGMLDRIQAASDRQRRFVSDASHELRSPVSSIRTQLEVALMNAGAAGWEELARDVLAENERVERLVADLLTLARLDEGAEAPAAEVDLDHAVLDEARLAHDPRVRTEHVAPARVRGDREQLGRLVRNLLDNARRHAREQVRITVRQVNGSVALIVDDDGAGIPPDDRERVFERFARLDGARARTDGGVGLGLAVVRAIAERHGGSARADGSPLGGARLEVTLPAHDGVR